MAKSILGTNNFGNGTIEIGLCNGLLNRNPPSRTSSIFLVNSPFLSLLRSDDFGLLLALEALLWELTGTRCGQRLVSLTNGGGLEASTSCGAVLGRLRTAITSYISGRPKAATKPTLRRPWGPQQQLVAGAIDSRRRRHSDWRDSSGAADTRCPETRECHTTSGRRRWRPAVRGPPCAVRDDVTNRAIRPSRLALATAVVHVAGPRPPHAQCDRKKLSAGLQVSKIDKA